MSLSMYTLRPSSIFQDNWGLTPFPFRHHGLLSKFSDELTKPMEPLMSTDLIETENDFHIRCDLPGVEAKDMEITVNDRTLTIKAERKESHKKDTDTVHSSEVSYGSVQRQFRLPANADVDKSATSFKSGVLSVTFPKKDVAAGVKKLVVEEEKTESK